MMVRQLKDAEASERRVVAENWQSVRMLLSHDQVGFSFHITTIFAGTETHIHYRNHFEAVYCIRGVGEIEDLATGTVHAIRPGTLYVLDQHDDHLLRASEQLELACVFNPPLHGTETHDADGVYPLLAPVANG